MLNRGLLSRQKFLLTDAAYPLDGTIVLNMKCYSETGNDPQSCHGFLSVYQTVEGFGSWSRFWCALNNSQLYFWRYPEDEEKKVFLAIS